MAAYKVFGPQEAIAERSTAELYVEVLDKDGAAVALNAISAIDVTMLDSTGAIVNGHNAQNVLNTNGGTLETVGGATVFRLAIAPDDTICTAGGGETQTRRIELHVQFSGGHIRKAYDLYVKDLRGI